MFPELSLTPENLSTVLDSLVDGLWSLFGHYVNIPDSERGRIRSQYSSTRECKQATISSLISGHPAPSWRLVAHALYQMGPGYGDSCHRALDRLQQLFPTGTATPCTISTVCIQRVCLTCAYSHIIRLSNSDHSLPACIQLVIHSCKNWLTCGRQYH